MFKKISYTILLVSLLISSCKSDPNVEASVDKANPVVSIFGQTLYADDVAKNLSDGLSQEDSTAAAKLYVKKWVNEQLIYDKAKSNTSDQQQIDKLVEDYRKSLTIYTYQEKLLKEALSQDISENELRKYYDEHQSELKLESYIVKGLFLKIPSSSAELPNLKKWYKSNKSDAKENIEKASIQNVVIYNYFYDRWTDLDDITVNIPSATLNSGQMVKGDQNIEVSDSTYTYLLHVEEYLQPGSPKPFDYAKNQIKDILINRRREAFVNQLETDLYNRASDKKLIKYYNE